MSLSPLQYPLGLAVVFCLGATGAIETLDAAVRRSCENGPSFRVSISQEAMAEIANLGLETPIDGRVYILITREGNRQPRLQTGVRGIPFWGVDVEDLTPKTALLIDDESGARGYPFTHFCEIPDGDYQVQAFLNVYTKFQRSDGHTVKMHLNSGAGQNIWRAPGNAHSDVQSLKIVAGDATDAALQINQIIPPIEPLGPGEVLQQGNPGDLEWVKFVKIQSQLLSEFWGRPMFIGANVLLPKGYQDNTESRYPVIYLQGHFPGRRAPMGLNPKRQGRRSSEGLWEFWNSEQAPRFLVVTFRDANPYYDTSYSVDSANVGPYGKAITTELIPYIEKKFRAIGEPWARVLAGGSTGGWEALGMQVFYPDYFGGSWAWCPDPVDFHYYQIVDIYEDENAYKTEKGWLQVERPNHRRPDGNIISTIRQENQYEQACGSHSRSGGQWAIWEAVFGPVGADGYPRPIWQPESGAIDRQTAESWKQNYDLTDILRRDWLRIGSSLAGKIRVAVGDMDSYYLEQAVYLLEDLLSSLESPPAAAKFEYGRRQPHCWIGASPGRPGEEMSYREFIQIVADHIEANAPAAAKPLTFLAGGARQ